MSDERSWHSVKCVFRHEDLPQQEGQVVYEERIVLLRAHDLNEAIALGEAEAEVYSNQLDGVRYTGFISAFHLLDTESTTGVEVYSLMRVSPLDTDAFLDRYYDDGTERTQH